MAINITEGCMDTIGTQMVCNSIREAIAPAEASSREGETIPYHRHCQKTVCSAAGYNDTGKTWNILCPNAPGDLINLQRFIPQGTTWQEYFQKNDNNITQDLRSILELMNSISGQVATQTSWRLVFNDCDNREIASNNINPWSGAVTQTYSFTNFGRSLTLEIDGQELKFHTINPSLAGSDEQLSIDFSKKQLTIQLNGTKVGEVDDIYMPNDTTINIIHDYNEIPSSGAGDRHDAQVEKFTIYRNIHIYKVYKTIDIDLNIDLSKYVLGSPAAASPVIGFELHVRNENSSESGIRINLTPPTVVNPDGQTVVPLTDQLWVDAATTNVYVFRWDGHTKVLTYSLAYVY